MKILKLALMVIFMITMCLPAFADGKCVEEYYPKYSYLSYFEDGLAIGRDVSTGKTTVIDTNNEMVFTGKNAKIIAGNGYIVGCNDDGFFIYKYEKSEELNLISEMEGVYYIPITINNNYIVISANKNDKIKFGIIDIHCKEIIPIIYDFVDINENTAICYDEDEWKVINLAHQNIVFSTPFENTYQMTFNELGTITISKQEEFGEKYGVVDYEGNILIDTIYENIETTSDYYILSRDRENPVFMITDVSLNKIMEFSGVFRSINDNCVIYADNSSWIISDLNGNILFTKSEEEISKIGIFVNGISAVQSMDGAYYYIDKNGEKVSPELYGIAYEFYNNYAVVGNYKISKDNEIYIEYKIIDDNFNTVKILHDIIPCCNKNNKSVSFEDGYIITYDKISKKYGFISLSDSSGDISQEKYIITFIFNDTDITSLESSEKTEVIIPQQLFTNPGYTFSHWTDGINNYNPGDTFIMPDHDVTMTAVWEKDTPDEPTPTKPDTSITDWSPIINNIINNKPTSNDKNKPDSKPADTYTCPYVDIAGHWAEDIIKYIDELGLIDGITETEFKPDEPMTREMFVTAIARLCGVEQDYVTWAIDNGILLGYGNGEYGLSDTVTREQMAVFFVRFFDKMNIDTTELKTIENYPFADDDIIADWSSDAVYEIQSIGLIKGKENNIFDPKGTATRAEAATVLYNLIQSVLEEVK